MMFAALQVGGTGGVVLMEGSGASGAVVQWCSGAVVQWCSGAVVPWCRGAGGTAVQQCSGAAA